MNRPLALTVLLACAVPLAAVAQSVASASIDQVEEQWRERIGRFESDGGRNLPNFRYDARHTAGGVCQMTDETWREIAKTVDIDIGKFPNAGSASEHQQWQACWKLHALRGDQPWACCNKRYQQALNLSETKSEPRRRGENASSAGAAERHDGWPNPFMAPAAQSEELFFNVQRK